MKGCGREVLLHDDQEAERVDETKDKKDLFRHSPRDPLPLLPPPTALPSPIWMFSMTPSVFKNFYLSVIR